MSTSKNNAPPRTFRSNRESSEADTDGIQEDYRRELARRLSAIQAVIEQSVGDENDALNLRTNAPGDIGPRESFDFPTTAAKQAAFKRQLQAWLDEGLLEPVGEDAVRSGSHYTSGFVRRAYEAGLRFADRQLRRLGISTERERDIELTFQRPIHQTQLEDLYTRNFSKLEDISEDIDESLSEILTRGVAQGYNPERMARELTDEIGTIQRTRARRLARTETLFSHNNASKTRYREMGVGQVEVLTHTPCDICTQVKEDGPYPVDGTPPNVPAHPNCVCALSPVI